VVLALAASALLTAAVSLPMAYQAREARQQTENPPVRGDRPEVLGTTTIREPEAVTGDLFWELPPDTSPAPLHLATVPGAPRIFLQGDDVVRADFRLDDGPVESDRSAPFELSDGAPVVLPPGGRSLTVTVSYGDGRTVLHQAFFTATG
jgi:hypothetical protein